MTTSPAARLADLVARPESEIDLATGALLIAAEEYPQLQVAPYIRRLDLLAERVKDRLAGERAPLVVLEELCGVLFDEKGFRGNADAYQDPRNSFLNDVLDRRLGIPITLGIVTLEVGWRVGLPLEGINFPGHFLVRYGGEVARLLVDPFDAGRIRWEDEAQSLLDKVYGGMVRMRPEFLRPATRSDILARVLTNLKGIYLNAGDDARSLAAIDRILLIRPASPIETRDRGLILARSGRRNEAVVELERYLDRVPAAPDAQRVRSLIEDLSAE
ncbi:MAG: tetratricopeptide repeat protein [Longimicrobiales bacterium]|nr:tetratricopeptide repeat protein [Longimicrobiales bacterium]